MIKVGNFWMALLFFAKTKNTPTALSMYFLNADTRPGGQGRTLAEGSNI